MSKFVTAIATSFALFAVSLNANETPGPVEGVEQEVVKNDEAPAAPASEHAGKDDCGCGGKKQ